MIEPPASPSPSSPLSSASSLSPSSSPATGDPSEAEPKSPPVYVTGGSVLASKGLYLRRHSDDEMLRLCRAGQFAYVLAPRQIGKSSLMDATIRQLAAEGIRSARVDLNEIGVKVNAEQWFVGFLTIVERKLRLGLDEVDEWWEAQGGLSNVQRLMRFFETEVLTRLSERVIIFVDEIDATLALDFTDDFFAVIRSMLEARAEVAAFERLSFVLLGVAQPGELIRDPRRTPFNIGERVVIEDFRPAEAAPLAEGLGLSGGEAGPVLERILWWTNGHPYLTQTLCKAWADGSGSAGVGVGSGPGAVDKLVALTFFGRQSETDKNLQFVRGALTLQAPAGFEHEVLTTYARIWRGRVVRDDRQSVAKEHLKLAGAVRVERGRRLVVRNRIYRQVFDASWVKRQQEPVPLVAALRRLAPLLAVGVLIFLLVAALAVIAFLQFQTATSNAATAQANRNRAFTAEANANYNAVTAVAERNRAVSAESNANNNAATAVAERNQTETQRNLALSRKLATQIQPLLPTSNGNVGSSTTAFLLSIQARRLNTQVEATNPFNEAALIANNFPSLAGHSDYVLSVAFSPDSKTLVSASSDKTIRLWDVASHSPITTLAGHSSYVNSVAFSPNGKFLASASEDKTIRLWDIASHSPIATLAGHSASVSSVVFSPDGNTLASASVDNTIRLWDIASHSPIATLVGHSSYVSSVAFSPDGKILASASSDSNILLWNVASHSLIAPLPGHSSSVWSVAFSPDGRTLASASVDRTIRLWDIGSHSPIATLAGHSSYVTTVAFSPDGKTLASASYDKTVRLWDNWYTGDWLDRACKLAGRNLTWAEWKQYAGVGEPYLQTCPMWPLPADLPADQKSSLTPAPTPSSPTLTPAPTPTAKP